MKKQFKWTDELIKEMIYGWLPVPEHYFGSLQRFLDEFKRTHSPATTVETIREDYIPPQYRVDQPADGDDSGAG